MDRRTVFRWMARGIGAAVAAAVGVPLALLGLSPAWQHRRRAVWQPVGRLADLPVDQIQLAQVPVPRDDWARTPAAKGVYVWRPNDDEVVVFSRNCTDLSCPVTFDPGSQCFVCPCHGGIFNRAGQPMAGPPPRPLYRYLVRVQRGMVEIDLNSLPPMT